MDKHAQSPATAEAGQESTANNSLTEDAFAQILMGEQQPDDPEAVTPTDAEEPEIEEQELEADEAEVDDSDEEEGESQDDELQGFDLDNLTEEEIEKLRVVLKSKAAARIGKLTGENKALREELDNLRRQSAAETPEPEARESRFLQGIDSPEQLADKVRELKKLQRDVDTLLDENEHLDPQDYIEVGDKSFTKSQLKALKRDLRDTLDEAVPYKQHLFHKNAQRQQLSEAFAQKARDEVKELADEESEVAKQYHELNNSDLFKQVREKVPDAAPALGYVLAHFCRSVYGKAKPAAPAQQKPTRQAPPENAAVVAAMGAAPAPAGKKRVQDKMRAFEQSGSVDALADFLASQS